VLRVIVFLVGLSILLIVTYPLIIFVYDSMNGNFFSIRYSISHVNRTHIVFRVNLTYLNSAEIHDFNITVEILSEENKSIARSCVTKSVLKLNESLILELTIPLENAIKAKYVALTLKGVIGGIYPISVKVKEEFRGVKLWKVMKY